MALTDFLTQIADSIRSKDGTTDTIKATDFPQRILNITSGGGGLPENIKTGTINLSEDSVSVTIEHGLGHVPSAIIFFDEDGVLVNNNLVYSMIEVESIYGAQFAIWNDYQGNKTSNTRYTVVSEINENTFKIVPIADRYYFRSGITYRWFAWG